MTVEPAAEALMDAAVWAPAPEPPTRRIAVRKTAPKPARETAEHLPVARVCVDNGLAHLDRPFDYLVQATLDEAAQPGVRVRVRFAGQLLDGLILERAEASEHAGKLASLEKVVSPIRVLSPEIARLAREIADRYAGTMADVIRLAIPPRHARAEATYVKQAAPGIAPRPGTEAASGTRHTPNAAPSSSAEAASDTSAGAGSSTEAASDTRSGPSTEAASGMEFAAGSGTRTVLGTTAPSAAEIVIGTDSAFVAAQRSIQDLPAFDGLAAGWRPYPHGPAFLHALGEGRAARAVWGALPGEDWPARIAEAVAATLHAGRGALVVVADARDLDRVDGALTAVLGAGRHVALSAAVGPAERYSRFLRVLGGDVRAVIGTRAACFAPVTDLGLVVIWDDGDDLHAEPRSPYPNAREVLLTRALQSDAAALIGGFGRTVEAAQLIDNGWAKEIVADRDAVRSAAPLVTAIADDMRDPQAMAARMPSAAWRAARDALAAGNPVLVQVPRRGYLPSVACATCRAPARCPHCRGPLSLGSSHGHASCRWCARIAGNWACAECGGRSLRASVVGARRTAEELGRVFADVPIWTSGRDGVLTSVAAKPGLVVATPGAEPFVERGGYGAVLLLDTWALLTRADLRAGEETLRRWLAAASLALPASKGGQVVVVADGSLAAVQALVRFDPGWLAAHDLAERRELGFPPTVRMASLTGAPDAVADMLAAVRLPDGADVLGPVPVADGQERYLVRVPRSSARALSGALHAAAGVRSARKSPDPVRVQIDPLELL